MNHPPSQPELDRLLRQATAETPDQIGAGKVASAIQAFAATPKQIWYRGAFGRLHLESPDAPLITEETPFDIASVTKSLVGATLAIQAIDEERVSWSTPLAELLPGWSRRDGLSQSATFLHLLNHTSGLPAWRKFYLEHPLDPDWATARKTRTTLIDAILETPLKAPPGSRHTYSDLGYLLLALILERLFDDQPLDELAKFRIFEPLKMHSTNYISLRRRDPPLIDAVATERCPLRGRLICGEVHDENTNIIGGVSTHAGVFSTASDLVRFGLHLVQIDQGLPLEDPLVSRQSLHFAWSPAAGPLGSHRAGWDTPSGAHSSAGRSFPPDQSVGHLGFTGTSLWIHRPLGLVSVLLTNRVYPSRQNQAIKGARISFQEALLS